MPYAINKYGEDYIKAVEKFLDNPKTCPVQAIKLSDVYTPQSSQVRITAKLADHIDDLERNIEVKGQEEPIIVEANGNGGYDAVEGVNRIFTFRRLAQNAPTDSRWFTIKAKLLPQGFFPSAGHRKFAQAHFNKPEIKRSCTQADVQLALEKAVDDGVFGPTSTSRNVLVARMRSWVRKNYNFKETQVKSMTTRAANAQPTKKGIEIYTKDEANSFVDTYCVPQVGSSTTFKVLPGTMDNVERRLGRLIFEMARGDIPLGNAVKLFVHFPNIHSDEKNVQTARKNFMDKIRIFNSLGITDAAGNSRKLVDEVYFLPQMKNLEKQYYANNKIVGPFI